MAVYMIRAGESGPVKIGHSTEPEMRLSQLQVCHWETLRIIRLFEGGEPEEFLLHERFIDLHIRGEWHSFSRAMMGSVGLVEIDSPTRRMSRLALVTGPPAGLDHHNRLLAEIEEFLTRRKMAESTFGRIAVNDGKFMSRLRLGKNMTVSTINQVREFIRTRSSDAA